MANTQTEKSDQVEVLFTPKSKAWIMENESGPNLGKKGFDYLKSSLAKIGEENFGDIKTEEQARKALGKRPSDISERIYDVVVALLSGQSKRGVHALELNDKGQYFVPIGEGIKAFKIVRSRQEKEDVEFRNKTRAWLNEELGEDGVELLRRSLETSELEDKPNDMDKKTYDKIKTLFGDERKSMFYQDDRGVYALDEKRIAAYRKLHPKEAREETASVEKQDENKEFLNDSYIRDPFEDDKQVKTVQSKVKGKYINDEYLSNPFEGELEESANAKTIETKAKLVTAYVADGKQKSEVEKFLKDKGVEYQVVVIGSKEIKEGIQKKFDSLPGFKVRNNNAGYLYKQNWKEVEELLKPQQKIAKESFDAKI